MRKMKLTAAVLITALALSQVTGCSSKTADNTGSTAGTIQGEAATDGTQGSTAVSDGSDSEIITLDTSDMFSNRDMKTEYEDGVKIELSGKSASCDSSQVSIDGGDVTITSEGTYIISGTLEDGSIIIDASDSDKIQLVLDNVDITSVSGAAIYVKKADKVFITMAQGSVNTLASEGEYVSDGENNVDAVIFAKDDITLNGNGTLNITSECGHGIVSKDDLVITSGTYVINSAKKGLSAKDSIRIADGDFTINSGKDAIHAENEDDAERGYVYIADGNFKIVSETDGISASYITQIDDGTFDITTGGGSANASTKSDGSFNMDWGRWGRPEDKAADGSAGNTAGSTMADNAGGTSENQAETSADSSDDETASAKGIKADYNVIINGGSYNVDSSDDAFHSNEDVQINAGTFTIATGDDGIHADSQTVINDGDITITKCYEGIEGQSVTINGGNIDITAQDDAINAAGGNDQSASMQGGRPGAGGFSADENAYISITGGIINISADGDGIDSNGNLYVSGGEIYVDGPANDGDGALDYDGEAVITGGTVIAVGMSGMAQNFGSSSTQCSALVNLSETLDADTKIELKDSNGNTVITYTAAKRFNSVVISCAGLKTGETYTFIAGTQTVEIEMTDTIYGDSTGFGGPDGGNGNPGDRPQMPDGEMPSMPDGEMPSMPDGQMPGGEMPSMPDGQMPGSEMPTMGNGQMSGGEMPTMGNGQASGGEMPTMGNGQMPGGGMQKR